MSKLTWNDKLSIDCEVIDNDHRLLIDIINVFLERAGNFKTSDEAMEVLEKLDRYAQKQFTREEELQRLAKFPERDKHFNEHVKLRKRLSSLMIETRPTSGSYVNTMGEKISEFLRYWLFEHIMVSDRKMRPYVKSMATFAAHMPALSHDDLVA